MRLSTLAIALAATATTASAQPIVVLNGAPEALRAAAPPSDCASAAAGAGADIECVLNLTPPRHDAEPAAPRRILIRAQWTPKPCRGRDAQVVALSAPKAHAAPLPVVDQAGSGRSCGS